MDESIVLLSSMSPKFKLNGYVKANSILALKKNIRRSSVCDKLVKTVKNENAFIVESNCSSSSSSKCSKELTKSVKLFNRTPIVISDSESSEPEDENLEHRTPEQSDRCTTNCLLSKEKIKEINLWIDGIDEEKVQGIHETTRYSEMSTIDGDIGENFQPKESGNAASSTLINSQSKRFDELFKKSTNNQQNDNELGQQLLNLVIEDSFVDCDIKTDDPKQNSENFVPNNTSDRSSEKSFHSTEGCQINRVDNEGRTPTFEADNVEEIGSLLDSIYGKSWREKEDQILPKSEPRKNYIKHVYVTHSERKANTPMLFKNLYLESGQSKSQTLLKTLHCSRFEEKFESPFFKKVHDICDSDSPVILKKTKARLNFDDSSHDELKYIDRDVENDEQTDDKENFDVSDLGLSLEEKIRKKMFKIPEVLPSTKNKKSAKKNERRKKVETKKKKSPLQNVPIVSNVNKNKTGEIMKAYIEQDADKNSSGHSITVSSDDDDDDDEWNRRISTIVYRKPIVGNYSFLASLSASVPINKCDMSARIFRNNFKNYKDELLRRLFNLYNEQVFDSSIPADTILEWNDRMRGTAGVCYCRKTTRKNGAVERTVRIVLANKVIDSADRMRDTLIHEMCHAATWIVNCVSDGHGKYWKSWAFKAMKTFPELPPITRCHNYAINTKYTYRCTGCGYSIGRHSKSLDIERKRCGYCMGKFEVLLNKIGKKGEAKSVPVTPKKEASGFALFVKQNYGSVKKTDLKHGDVMKILGQKFQEIKLNNKS